MRVALLALAACGRLGFDPGSPPPPPGDGSAVDGATVDAVMTGPVGDRWATTLDAPNYAFAAGTNGEALLVGDFSTTLHVGTQTYTGQGFQSAVAMRFSRTGGVLWSTVLDATGFCDMRGAITLGDSLLAFGLTDGGDMPTYGPCAILTGRQDPVAVSLDGQGAAALDLHFVASGANAQMWRVAQLGDGSLAVSGIYGSDLMIGATALRTTPAPPMDNAWFARVPAGGGDPVWASEIVSTGMTWAEAISGDGTDTCIIGAYSSSSTLFGQALPFQGGSADEVVARVGGDGTPRFVRALGTTGTESTYRGSTIAMADGGCLVSFEAGGDLTVDSTTFLAADGGGVLLRFDANGALVAGTRVASGIELARSGTRIFGTMDITAPTLGYTPAGTDVIVVEIDAAGALSLLGVVGGAGDQIHEDFYSIAAIAPDALAVTVSTTGAFTFAGQTSDSGATKVQALAVLGVSP